MTDDLDPGRASGSADDETTRTALPPQPVAASPATPVPDATPATPTAPLTPASRPDSGSGTPIYENDVAWAIPAPVKVAGSDAPKQRRGRLRWAAAIAVVALVVGASAAAAALLTGSSSTATVLGYVPEHTLVYGEVRLDLPGDQKQAVGAFLSKFPGFADQASLDSKLDEVLDDLIRDASNGKQTYTGNIKAWFDGELAFAVGPLPPATSLTNGDVTSMSSFRMLALLSVKDPVAAAAWFDAAFKEAGATPTTETHDGTTVTVFPATAGVTTAYALIDGKVAVFGDLVSVKAAIDTNGDGGFAKEDGPKAALDSSSGDHVGFMYFALRPLLDWSTGMQKELMEGAVATELVSDAMLKLVPEWGAYWLSFESDALVAEAVAPRPETTIGSTENRRSTIVEHVPATAVVASVANDLGKTLREALDLYRSEESMKPILDQLDQGLGLVGGVDAAFGWAGDTAIVVNDSNGTPEGGLIIAATDKEAPGRLITALKTFLALGGAQQGITVRDEDHNGTTITIIDVGDVSKVAGDATMFALPVSGNLEIAVAVSDDIVVIGSGPDFVKHVLDTEPSTSLASTDGYKKLADKAGTGTSATYVAIDSFREMYEKSFAKDDPAGYATYQKDIEPYLEPLDSLFIGSSVDGDLGKSVFIITVQ
ncbi:MAG TPA: DUF3352 domain-containing protein [Candidatus Limnocylindrales bacterium]